MNDLDIRYRETYGGFFGEFRKVHRADFEQVQENGVPVIFSNEAAALQGAFDALRGHLCGDILGDNPRASFAKSKAESLFGKIFPGKGKKPVDVVRR